MQSAGHRVSLAVKLAAGVQHRQRDLDAGLLELGVDIDRNAATVIDDPNAAVVEQGDHDRVAEACQRLVDSVVDHLPHEVMQATLAGGADVHARPFAYSLEPFQGGE